MRLDKIAIRTAIAELREVDERYDGYGEQTTHGNTAYPAFTVRIKAGQASRSRHPERVGRAFDWFTTVDPREVARGPTLDGNGSPSFRAPLGRESLRRWAIDFLRTVVQTRAALRRAVGLVRLVASEPGRLDTGFVMAGR